jgi:transposase InsO family protein
LYNRKKRTGTLIHAKRGPIIPWNKPDKDFERTVVFIKRKTDMPNSKISRLLTDKGYPISAKGVGNILARYPLPKKRRKIIRYEKQSPGELGHIDVHKLKNIKGQNPKEKYYLAALEDDCTRITYSERIPDKTASTLTAFTKRALEWFSQQYVITFKSILSDNGKEFTTHWKAGRSKHCFEKFLKQEDISHRYTRPYRPQTNGKVEAFWKIVKKELLQKYWFHDWDHFDELFSIFMNRYNRKREHGGIGKLTPEEKLISLNQNLFNDFITELSA